MADNSNHSSKPTTILHQDRWESIWQSRDTLAQEIRRAAIDLRGDQKQRHLALSHWFESSQNIRDALRRADVLEICLPFVESPDQPNERNELEKSSPADFDAAKLARAVRFSLESMENRRSNSRELIQLLYYPFLVMFGCAILAVAYSFFVAPVFETMFDEFGIQLPLMTEWFLSASKFVRKTWWLLFAVPLVGAIVIMWLDLAGRNKRPANLSWLDEKLMSIRNALADWAWHVALLIRAGLSQSEATQIAAKASGSSQLRYWVGKQTNLTRNASSNHVEAGKPSDVLKFNQPIVKLLDCALQQPTRERKIALLTETAHYYWDKNRTIGSWWIHWLIAATIWSIGAIILLGITALFMPLFSIIGGLM